MDEFKTSAVLEGNIGGPIEEPIVNDADTAKLELEVGHPNLVHDALLKRQSEPVMVVTRQVIESLKEIEARLKGGGKKFYPDPNRITVPVSTGAVITHVPAPKGPIPRHV